MRLFFISLLFGDPFLAPLPTPNVHYWFPPLHNGVVPKEVTFQNIICGSKGIGTKVSDRRISYIFYGR